MNETHPLRKFAGKTKEVLIDSSPFERWSMGEIGTSGVIFIWSDPRLTLASLAVSSIFETLSLLICQRKTQPLPNLIVPALADRECRAGCLFSPGR